MNELNKKLIKIKLVDGFPINEEFWKPLLEELNKKYRIEFSDTPDYLLCGCFSNEFLKYNCVKIQLLGENISPDFNLYDYAIGFDWMNYGDRYLRFPIYYYWKSDFDDAIHKHEKGDEYFLSKKRFCNQVVSNGKWNDTTRDNFFHILCKYKKVDSGGRHLNNIGYPVPDKKEFQSLYKFSIAMENSRKDGYTTEKILNAFAAGTIPIYWGNPLIKKEFNPKSFINVFDFSSLEECIEYIKEIDNDDSKYLKMQHEPIFTDDKYILKKQSCLYDFLCKIFDQPCNEARRIYNRETGYNSEYVKIIQKGWNLTMFYKKPIRVIRKLMKSFRG